MINIILHLISLLLILFIHFRAGIVMNKSSFDIHNRILNKALFLDIIVVIIYLVINYLIKTA